MYIAQLEDEFLEAFKNADEAWVAVGLMGKTGLRYLNEMKGNLHLLVGIDLPTPPDVLRNLMDRNTRSEIHFRVHSNRETFFHPKLYVIRNKNQYRAFVGSGNFTGGGWKDNIELFWQLEKEQECKQLIRWFERYMDTAILIDEPFITDYENRVYRPNEKEFAQQRERLNNFKEDYETDYEQFFRREDFEAFADEKTTARGEIAKTERKSVSDKLYKLHGRLYSLILEHGWKLYPNERKQDMISRWWHGPFVSKVLDGIWLYYGKSQQELLACQQHYGSDKSPNDHVRLQVIVRHDTVGVWCAIGKGHGSGADRRAFNEKIQISANREEFFQIVQNLGDEYFIDVAAQGFVQVANIINAESLYEIVNTDIDHLDEYFIIGMDIVPDDPRLRNDRIIPFITKEFSKLYPLYEFIKAPWPAIE